MLSGVIELAADIFKMPARLGQPIRFANLGGLVDEYRAPIYATAIGLVLEGDKREHDEESENDPVMRPLLSSKRNAPGFFSRIKNWLQDGLF